MDEGNKDNNVEAVGEDFTEGASDVGEGAGVEVDGDNTGGANDVESNDDENGARYRVVDIGERGGYGPDDTDEYELGIMKLTWASLVDSPSNDMGDSQKFFAKGEDMSWEEWGTEGRVIYEGPDGKDLFGTSSLED